MVFNWIHFRRVVTTLASQLVPLMIKRRRRGRKKRMESFLIRLHRLCLLSSWHSGRPRSESRLVKESSSTTPTPPTAPKVWRIFTRPDAENQLWNVFYETLKVLEWTNCHIPTFSGVRSILPRKSDFLGSWPFTSETPPWVGISGQKVEGTQTTPEFANMAALFVKVE